MHMNPDVVYEGAFKEAKDVVSMAEAGEYRKGYLTYAIRCLEILHAFGEKIHRPAGELESIQKKMHWFKEELEKPEDNFYMTPLENLFEERHFEEGTKLLEHKHDNGIGYGTTHANGHVNGNGHMNGNGHEKMHPDPKMRGVNPH